MAPPIPGTTHSKLLPALTSPRSFPAYGEEDNFICERISEAEIKVIEQWFDQSKEILYQKIRKKKSKEALHIPSKEAPYLPRSVLIYLNERREIRCLIQLKAHLANRIQTVEKKQEVSKGVYTLKTATPPQKLALYVGKGGNRQVKYVLDLHSRQFYAETINKGESKSNELKQLLSLHSPYISPLTCYSQYINSKNETVTVTVSPYHRPNKKFDELSEQQKIRGMLQLLLGVKAIHDKRMCHNDLTLNNMLVTNMLDFLIIDLDAATKHCPVIRKRVFTRNYEAPEIYGVEPYEAKKTLAQQVATDDPSVCKVRDEYNHQKNDIWSLGVCAYRLIAEDKDKNPTLEFVKSHSEQQASKSILIQLAHALLRPHRDHRPSIDDAIGILLGLIAEKSIDEEKFVLSGSSYNLDDDKALLALYDKIFYGISDIFFQMPLRLQQSITARIVTRCDIFKTIPLREKMQGRTVSLQKRFSIDNIIEILRTESVDPKDKQYHRDLNEIGQYIQSCDESEIESLSERINTGLKNYDFSTTLINFKKNSQEPQFKALLSFIMTFPQIGNFDLYNYATHQALECKNDKTTTAGGKEPSKTYGEIIKFFSLYNFTVILIKNFENLTIGDERFFYLITVTIGILTGYAGSIFSLEQRDILVHYLIAPKHLGVFNKLSEDVKTDYKKLLVEFSPVYIKGMHKDIKSLIKKEKLALPVFIKSVNRLSSAEIISWIKKLAKSLPRVENEELLAYSSQIDPSSWTLEQCSIFSVIQAINKIPNDVGITTKDRLVCLEKIFDAIQAQHNTLYRKRHATFDSIREFFGRGEKITRHRAVQLSVIRKHSYNYLQKMSTSIESDQQKIKVYREYQNKGLFQFHRKNGFFYQYKAIYYTSEDGFFSRLKNCLKSTYHQNLIQTSIENLELKLRR